LEESRQLFDRKGRISFISVTTPATGL
jgi:hypothetical protein